MLRSTIVVCTIALSFSAQAEPQPPPFSSDDTGAVKVLKLIRWVTMIDDLASATATIPATLGLNVEPSARYSDHDGNKVKSRTYYLFLTPIFPGAQINYWLPEPTGPQGGRLRAAIILNLAPQKACVRYSDMVSYFGEPSSVGPAEVQSQLFRKWNPWSAGKEADWILRQTPWKIEMGATFRSENDGCTLSVGISQSG